MEINTMPFELNRLYNLDSENAIKMIPDKYFELAIIDPPYGIKASEYKRGGQQHGNAKAASKKYGSKDWDKCRLGMNISKTFSGSQKTRLFSGRTILSAGSLMIPHAGSCGIRKTEIMTMQIANLRGRVSKSPFGYSGSGGRGCFKGI